VVLLRSGGRIELQEQSPPSRRVNQFNRPVSDSALRRLDFHVADIDLNGDDLKWGVKWLRGFIRDRKPRFLLGRLLFGFRSHATHSVRAHPACARARMGLALAEQTPCPAREALPECHKT